MKLNLFVGSCFPPQCSDKKSLDTIGNVAKKYYAGILLNKYNRPS